MEHLDLATVINVSQTVSGEMVLEKLLDTLMRAAVEYAGAERSLLILSREAEQRIAAEATICNGAVVVHLRDEPVASLDISPNLSASGPRISESGCATTTFRRFEETPDADRVYPRSVRICTRGGPRSGGRFRRGRHDLGCWRAAPGRDGSCDWDDASVRTMCDSKI